MMHISWKSPAMHKYIKLYQVMFPFKDFGVQISALSEENYTMFNSTPLTKQSCWFQAFPGKEEFFDQTALLEMS